MPPTNRFTIKKVRATQQRGTTADKKKPATARPQKKSIAKFIPSLFDVDNFLKDHPLPIPGKRNHRDYIVYILDLAISLHTLNFQVAHVAGFVPLHSKALEDVVPSYNTYLAYLIAFDVIECDDSYIVDEKARWYRIHRRYAACPLKREEVTAAPLVKNEKKYHKKLLDLKKIYRHLVGFFDARLTMDTEQATKWVEVNSIDFSYPVLKDFGLTVQQVHYMIATFNEHLFWRSVSYDSGRLFTNLTNLRRELRGFLKFESTPLVEVDIANAQPFFLLAALSPDFYASTTALISLATIERRTWKEINIDDAAKSKIEARCRELYVIDKRTGTLERSDELQRYWDWVTRGTFYENVAAEFTRLLGMEFTREHVKQAMFTVFFSANEFLEQDHPKAELKRVFKEIFPKIYSVLEAIKDGNNSRLAIWLQSIEAHAVIKTACDAIMNDSAHRGMPLFTIHDSIVSTAGNESYLHQELEKAMRHFFGIVPPLRIKNLLPKPIEMKKRKASVAPAPGHQSIAAAQVLPTNILSKTQIESWDWKPSVNRKTVVRLLLYPHNKNHFPFAEVWWHGKIGTYQQFVCPKNSGDRCAVCDLSEKYFTKSHNKTTPDHEEFYKLYELTRKYTRFYAPILVRGYEQLGVKFWSFTPTAWVEDLLPWLSDVQLFGDVFDPESGRDLIVNTAKYFEDIKRRRIVIEVVREQSRALPDGSVPHIGELVGVNLPKSTPGLVDAIVRSVLKSDGKIDLPAPTRRPRGRGTRW